MFCHTTFSKLIKIIEKLLNSDSLHHNHSSNPIFSIIWVTKNVNAWLAEAVIQNINLGSVAIEESAVLSMSFAKNGILFCNWLLSNIRWEHVFWFVNILAEVVIVYFFGSAFVTILPNQQIKHFFIGWHQTQGFHYS